MSETFYLWDTPEGWELVAEIDESYSYDVDQTRIYKNNKARNNKYILATATGCSCWGGDWEVSRYSSMAGLLKDIGPNGTSNHDYNPSFKGVEDLRRQVKNWESRTP